MSAKMDPRSGENDRVYCFWHADAEGRGHWKNRPLVESTPAGVGVYRLNIIVPPFFQAAHLFMP